MPDGPDRAAVESELASSELRTLRAAAIDLKLEPDDWWSIPALRDYAVLLAGLRRAMRFEATEGCSWPGALERGAVSVGRSEAYFRVMFRRLEQTATEDAA